LHLTANAESIDPALVDRPEVLRSRMRIFDLLFAIGTWLVLFFGVQRLQPDEGRRPASPLRAAAFATVITIFVTAISIAKY